jgi:hypothetical protein
LKRIVVVGADNYLVDLPHFQKIIDMSLADGTIPNNDYIHSTFSKV